MIQVLLFALLLSGSTVRGEDNVPKLNINQSIAYYNDCSFSAKNFTASCVLDSCPNLSQKCPSPTGGGCSAISPLLSQCLQQPEAVICGVRVAHTPICPLEIELFGITKLVSGSCLIKPNTGFIDGLQNATFCVTGSKGPSKVSISAPNITSYASYSCSFVLFNTTIRAPDVDVKLIMDIQATATVDVTARPYTVVTEVDRSDISFDTADFNGLAQNIVDILTDAFADEFRAAKTDLAAANFLATYAASALQNSDKSCFRK